jgi:tetratricopeptide (TPR) repeat protein
MNTKFSFPRGLAVIVCSFCMWLAAPALAQQPSNEVTPQVQQLYAQAVSAEHSGDLNAAIAKYREMIRLAPDIAPAYNNLGMLLFNEHNYPAAIPVLAHGLQINPRMGTSVIMLGLAYFEVGQNAKAKPLLEEAVQGDPSNADAQISLAHVLLNLGQDGDAITHLRAYLRLHPKDQQAWYVLGKTYLKLSESALGKVRQINPNSSIAHEVAGEIDEGMQNYSGAMVQYQKSVNLAPHDPSALSHLANIYWVMGKWQSAQSGFEKVLTMEPYDCQARWKLANSILQANGPVKTALADLDQSIHECPNLMQAHVDRARALIQEGKQKEALADLVLAEKNTPDEPMIHFYLAQVYRAEGNTAELHKELHTYAQLQQQSNEVTSKRVEEELKLKATAH